MWYNIKDGGEWPGPHSLEDYMENILNIENWIIVGLAALKMLSFFWPLVIVMTVVGVMMHVQEGRAERARNKRA